MLYSQTPQSPRTKNTQKPTVGQACDAHHITTPHPEGAGLAKALELALADAGLGKCVSFNVLLVTVWHCVVGSSSAVV